MLRIAIILILAYSLRAHGNESSCKDEAAPLLTKEQYDELVLMQEALSSTQYKCATDILEEFKKERCNRCPSYCDKESYYQVKYEKIKEVTSSCATSSE